MKNKMRKLGNLLKSPSFTTQKARERGVSASLLAHYAKKGSLEKLGRGVYRSVDAPTIEDFKIEDLIQSLANVKNGVICLTSALALYELTEEIPRQHWIAISHSTRHRSSNSLIKIVRLRNMTLGRTNNVSGGGFL